MDSALTTMSIAEALGAVLAALSGRQRLQRLLAAELEGALFNTGLGLLVSAPDSVSGSGRRHELVCSKGRAGEDMTTGEGQRGCTYEVGGLG